MTHLLTIPEIKHLIKEGTRKRLPPCEQSDINQQIVLDHELGFEAVLIGKNDEKILLPEDGAVVYLFRGQNQEYVPCYPSLYRDFPNQLTDSEIFTWRMRLMLFCEMLDTYPIVDKFFKRHKFKIDYEGLAQHYGLRTSVLDLTSNIDIALFFAVCRYDAEHECYRPFDDNKEHEGILYIFCPMLSNEPSPITISDFMKGNITPIGLQPFIRPARQKGYALHIKRGKSTKSWAYRFKFSSEESLLYYNLFKEGKELWVNDILAEKAKEISTITRFSYQTFKCTYEKFRPKGFSRTRLKNLLYTEGISLEKFTEKVSFSEEEKNIAIQKWNNGVGKQFCNTIGRRPWHIKIDENENEYIFNSNNNNNVNVRIGPINQYRTLSMLGEIAMLGLISNPEGPDRAVWVNYENTPTETHRHLTKEEQRWTKVPCRYVNLFAKRYLETSDYLI